MNVGDHVILTRPEKDCHKGKEAVIVKKLIDDAGVAIYRVQILGYKRPLRGWATDEYIKPSEK